MWATEYEVVKTVLTFTRRRTYPMPSGTYYGRNADRFPKLGSARSDCFDNDY
jgi:hypothetical protein